MRSGKVDLRNVNTSCKRAFSKPFSTATPIAAIHAPVYKPHIYTRTPITVLASRGNILFRFFTGVIHII